jgi:hypothetical protein
VIPALSAAAWLEVLWAPGATVDDVFPGLAGHTVRLVDLMSPAQYDRDGSDLVSRGLYLDIPPWSYHVFVITTT